MQPFRISRRLLLAGLAGLASIASLPLSAAPAFSNTQLKLLAPSDAPQALKSGNWKILDVRPVPPLDYISGHLPGAVHIAEQAFRGPNGRLPFQIWDANTLANLLGRSGISNKDSVLVYSDGINVLGATLVAYVLEKSGIPK
jgi:thiosulfate/3-mercaptopyruvate sulfurtransferase